MRVIGGKDYYDGASCGQDVTFIRTSFEVKNFLLPYFAYGLNAVSSVVFCGKVYPFWCQNGVFYYDEHEANKKYKIWLKNRRFVTHNNLNFKVVEAPETIPLGIVLATREHDMIKNAYWHKNIPIIANHAKLYMFQFYKVMNAQQAAQEIEMFVSGVLTNTRNPMVEISNIDKIKKAGFDIKQSFRHRTK